MSTKHIEALKLALEGAANYIDALGGDSRKYRQALAEQPAQQEPVAIALNTGTKQGVKWLKNVEHGKHLYTSPPAQRTWVGLTGDEWQAIVEDDSIDTIGAIKIAIEAKLKEKNT